MKKALLITICATAMVIANTAKAADCPDGVCPANATCECNANGKLTKKIKVSGDFSSEDNFTYDANDQLIKHTYDSFDTGYKMDHWENTYTYDARGNKTLSLSDENGWQQGLISTYDENNHITSNYNVEINEITLSTYDENGNKTSSIQYSSPDALENKTTDWVEIYTYDDENRVTSQLMGDSVDQIFEVISYTYEGGNTIMTDSYLCDGTEACWQMKTIYDSNWIKISETEFDCDQEQCDPIPSNNKIVCATGYAPGCIGNKDGTNAAYYANPPIVCATGYYEGCVGDTVTLSDGRTVFMQGGDILRLISKTSSDGSTTLYNEDGTIKGFKNKRIYTLDEANAVTKPTGNRVSIKYK